MFCYSIKHSTHQVKVRKMGAPDIGGSEWLKDKKLKRERQQKCPMWVLSHPTLAAGAGKNKKFQQLKIHPKPRV